MNHVTLFRNWKDVLEFPAGTDIFTDRDPADALYVILSGEVELKLRGELLSVEGEGGIIGEMAILDSANRNATATARADVRLARLAREQFTELMGQHNDFSLHVMAVLANRLRSVDAYITTHIDGKD